jgi:hypothetical protein
LALAERIGYGMLRVNEDEFIRMSLLRITRAYEWFEHEDEAIEKHARKICYYQANHKASRPEDLWMTYSEMVQRQKDLISGKLTVRVRKLTDEEVKNWTKTN